MKNSICLILSIVFLSGCATYKFHHGEAPYDKGYVVSRDDYTILEYTVGENNSVPRIKLAKERFSRRRKVVEDYYKKMGYIENHFKMAVWDPWVMFWKLVVGIFRLPFIAISDYRYEHNPKYREKIKKIGQEKDIREETRIKALKGELDTYIQKDLKRDSTLRKQPVVEEPLMLKQEAAEIKPAEKSTLQTQASIKQEMEAEKSVQETKPDILPEIKEEAVEINLQQQIKEESAKQKEEPVTQKEKKTELPEVKEKTLAQGPSAIIIAKPTKGYSPLKVRFYGNKSHSSSGKIVSYYWEFGDGDTSTKENPINTYWSATYGSVYFAATLTVKDIKGNTATASSIIEVMTR